MTEPQINRILRKNGIMDTGHYVNFYKMFPDDIWFRPTNNSDELFNIACDLHECGLLEMLKTPQWVNGSFVGNIIQFKKL